LKRTADCFCHSRLDRESSFLFFLVISPVIVHATSEILFDNYYHYCPEDFPGMSFNLL